ncbi:hypothetical protein M4D79_18830 [Mycolicibacterium novocastrense]|nr:hypothetical protein M4D79_18830 [Mycolicibacterium novocastrense]
MDETDTDGPDEDAAVAKHAEAAHDLVGEHRHRRVQRNDVERQPIIEELHGEDVVREHRADGVIDTERCREVQRRLDDQKVQNGREPEHHVHRITVASQPAQCPPQRQRSTEDDEELEDGQRPVRQPEGVAQVDHRR